VKDLLREIVPNALWKLLSSIYRKFFKHKAPVHIENIFGFDLYQNNNDIIDYSSYIGLSIENLPHDEDSRIFRTIKCFLNEGDIAIDVGANIGLMTLVMSSYCGSEGRVFSIEPGPVSTALLKRNLYVNGAIGSNVTLKECAISDFNGVIPLFINPNGESDNQVHKGLDGYEFRDEKSRQKVDVTALTLDNLLIEEGVSFDKVSFVKIDTQGHEWYVLNGGRKFFSESENLAVLCEFAPYLKSWDLISIEKFVKLIKSFGFLIYDDSNLGAGAINVDYLLRNYGADKYGKYTDLLLVKGKSVDLVGKL
jgi:FkbM family methyltransferase